MTSRPRHVYVVDDDDLMRKGVVRLLKSSGLEATAFTSAEDFLAAEIEGDEPSCLVLDIQMPGLNGLELQDKLIARNYCMPIIFITGHGDIPLSVQAMKKGAIDFLKKPFDDMDLLDAIDAALAKDEADKVEFAECAHARELIGRLTLARARSAFIRHLRHAQ